MKKLLSLLFIMTIALIFITPSFADDTLNAEAGSSSNSGGNYLGVDSHDTVNGSKIPENKRYYAPSGEINYPGAPNIFSAPLEQEDYSTELGLEDMLEYENGGMTTRDQLGILDSYSGGKLVMVRGKYGEIDKDKRFDLDKPMFVINKPVQGYKSLGTITILSESKKSISPDVFAKAQVEAWKLGGYVLYVKGEGWHLEVHNKSAGFGFTWTGATISGGQASSTTGVLGGGASWGQVGYYKHPYLVFMVLRPIDIPLNKANKSNVFSNDHSNGAAGAR